MRFFSPPEKPSFSARARKRSSISRKARFLRSSCMKAEEEIFSCGCKASRAAFRKVATDTPGMASGYWKARKTPRRARSSVSSASKSCPP